MSYVVSLEAFHGPLDLLLYLIDKNQVDIYDIPLARISDQFIDYLQHSGQYELEIVGDFLVMASYLLQLKSRMLLPVSARQQDEMMEEEQDPQTELREKLLAYKKIKETAEFLAARAAGAAGRVFYREAALETEIVVERAASVDDLLRAYLHLYEARGKNSPLVYLPQHDIDIEEKAAEIMDYLKINHNKMALRDVFPPEASRREVLVIFLALLELIRQQRVNAVQKRVFGMITIYAI